MVTGAPRMGEAARPSCSVVKGCSTDTPPLAARERISLTASTASWSTSMLSSSHVPAADVPSSAPIGAGSMSFDAQLMASLMRSPSERLPRLVRGPSAGVGLAVRAELAGLGRQLLEQLALAIAEARGHLDVDEHVQVATGAGPTQVGHALAAAADLGARLRAGLDLEHLLAVGRDDGDVRAQRRLRHRQHQLQVELGAVALEHAGAPRRG